MEKDQKISEKDAYGIAWEYFKLHGQQRLTYLNYFIVFSMALTTAQIGILTANIGLQYIGIIIGAMQIFLSFIFIKIDNRNTFFTKLAEKVLMEFESRFNFSDDKEYIERIKIFTLSEHQSAKQKGMSHRKTYKAIVYTFCSVGVLGMIAAIILTVITHLI